MSNTFQIYLISDSTGETLDRIFLALKAQFLNIEYKVHSYSFTRTENQILKILEDAEKNTNSIILYTIVDNNLAKYLANVSKNKKIPCFGVLGNLILNFSKILNQKATHEPSGQHILNEEYYDRIEAIQFTMNHDDGNLINEIDKLNKKGKIFLSFPSKESINFPKRIVALNYYDDPTHKDLPPNFELILEILREKGLRIVYSQRSYKPFLLNLIGNFTYLISFFTKKIHLGVWEKWGFESIIIAENRNANS